MKQKSRVLKINSKDYEQVISSEFQSWVLSAFQALNLDTDLYLASLIKREATESDSSFASPERMWKDHLKEAGIDILNVQHTHVDIVRNGKYVNGKWTDPSVVCTWRHPVRVRATTAPDIQIYLLEYTELF